MVPGTGIEPVQSEAPRDFKSLASTYSATQAHPFYNRKTFRCQPFKISHKKICSTFYSPLF